MLSPKRTTLHHPVDLERMCNRDAEALEQPGTDTKQGLTEIVVHRAFDPVRSEAVRAAKVAVVGHTASIVGMQAGALRSQPAIVRSPPKLETVYLPSLACDIDSYLELFDAELLKF